MPISEIAWAAGLFEGEGCLYEVRGQRLPHLSLTIEMADEDVISRFLAVLVAHGVKTRSRVTTRWRGNAKHSRVYAVKMTGKSAEAAYALMRPYLGKRRRLRGDEILARRRAAEVEARQVGTCVGCGQEFGVPLIQSEPGMTKCLHCPKPVPAGRVKYCCDQCSKAVRQRKWRDTHPEYRQLESVNRVIIPTAARREILAMASRRKQTFSETLREVLMAGLDGSR